MDVFKSPVIKELEDKCKRIDNLTLEDAQSGIIESASKVINDARYMTENRKSYLKTCIESLKKKIDEFYTLFKYDEDKFEIGKEYFELSGSFEPYKYKTLGTYIETKLATQRVTGGFGYVTQETHLVAVFTKESGLWIEPELGSIRIKIYTLKSSVNLNTPPPPSLHPKSHFKTPVAAPAEEKQDAPREVAGLQPAKRESRAVADRRVNKKVYK